MIVWVRLVLSACQRLAYRVRFAVHPPSLSAGRRVRVSIDGGMDGDTLNCLTSGIL